MSDSADDEPLRPAKDDNDLGALLSSLRIDRPDDKEAQELLHVPLRDYQTALLAKCNKIFASGERAVLCYLPTGGGKTRVGASAMINTLALSKSARCLFVVNRRSLLEQTRAALLDLGLEPSMIALVGGDNGCAAAQSVLEHARIHIAMVQSLHEGFRASHTLSQYTLAVVDECHAAAAPSYLALLADLPSSARVLGLTATPFRSVPGESLATVFPAAAWGPSVSALIESRVLVPPLIYGPSHSVVPPQLAKPARGQKATRAIEYDSDDDGDDDSRASALSADEKAQLRAAAEFTHAAVESWRRYADGARTVAFCHSIDASKALARAFETHGIRATHVDGTTKEEARARAFTALREHELAVLCNVDVLSEGFDEPKVGCVILLRHTESARVYVQQVGRGLRGAAGKSRCIILDLVGSTWKHGPLTGPIKSDYQWEAECATGPPRKLLRRCQCGVLLHRMVRACPGCDADHQPSLAERRMLKEAKAAADANVPKGKLKLAAMPSQSRGHTEPHTEEGALPLPPPPAPATASPPAPAASRSATAFRIPKKTKPAQAQPAAQAQPIAQKPAQPPAQPLALQPAVPVPKPAAKPAPKPAPRLDGKAAAKSKALYDLYDVLGDEAPTVAPAKATDDALADALGSMSIGVTSKITKPFSPEREENFRPGLASKTDRSASGPPRLPLRPVSSANSIRAVQPAVLVARVASAPAALAGGDV